MNARLTVYIHPGGVNCTVIAGVDARGIRLDVHVPVLRACQFRIDRDVSRARAQPRVVVLRVPVYAVASQSGCCPACVINAARVEGENVVYDLRTRHRITLAVYPAAVEAGRVSYDRVVSHPDVLHRVYPSSVRGGVRRDNVVRDPTLITEYACSCARLRRLSLAKVSHNAVVRDRHVGIAVYRASVVGDVSYHGVVRQCGRAIPAVYATAKTGIALRPSAIVTRDVVGDHVICNRGQAALAGYPAALVAVAVLRDGVPRDCG